MKFGLRGIRRLLRSVGDPHRRFTAIHIAGTNGKGSTASMIAAMLTAGGYKTGLYTSPHVVDFAERIRIDGKPISKRQVVRLMKKLRPVVRQNQTTFFETVTALAFLHFAKQEVEIAVVETGLGGRLDATNVVRPVISVITSIGLEHTEILGRTVREIAFEKAGIIKKKIPCITGVTSPAALNVIERVAREQRSELKTVSAFLRVKSATLDGTRLDVSFERVHLNGVTISLPGIHQAQNAALALAVVGLVNRSSKFDVSPETIRHGLKNIQLLSGLQGRLSVLSRQPLIIGDVAHNPDAVAALVASLQQLHVEKVILVFGVSKDKDYMKMIHLLKPITEMSVVVAAKTERSRDVWDLTRAFAKEGILSIPKRTVRGGMQRAQELARPGVAVLITGSHFVVGEAMAYLEGKNYLTINQ
jgi:dihydrofolate synthase/folylpolyglutamate synthase